MGAQFSQFHHPISQNMMYPDGFDRNSDWIVSHAMANNLTIPEVERLWLRYGQLGYRPSDNREEEHPILKDHFSRQIIKGMKNDSGEVSFASFVHALKWLETAEINEKLKGVFYLLNDGNPINRESLVRILKQIYPEKNERELQNTTQTLLDHLNTSCKDLITENDFIHWAQTLTGSFLDAILAFSILPQHLNRDSQSQFTKKFRGTTSVTSGWSRDHIKSPLRDETLWRAAEVMQRRDWPLVMNRLGYLQSDIRQFQQTSDRDKIYAMLDEWRRKEGPLATTSALNVALVDCGISPIA